MEDIPLPEFEKLTDHRSDWLQGFCAKLTVFGEEVIVGFIYETEEGGWCYSLSDENTETVGLSTAYAAQVSVNMAWGAKLVGSGYQPRTAEERAEFYKKKLISMIGSGDEGGYQDMDIVETLIAMDDTLGLDPASINMTHMPAHERVRLAVSQARLKEAA